MLSLKFKTEEGWKAFQENFDKTCSKEPSTLTPPPNVPHTKLHGHPKGKEKKGGGARKRKEGRRKRNPIGESQWPVLHIKQYRAMMHTTIRSKEKGGSSEGRQIGQLEDWQGSSNAKQCWHPWMSDNKWIWCTCPRTGDTYPSHHSLHVKIPSSQQGIGMLTTCCCCLPHQIYIYMYIYLVKE